MYVLSAIDLSYMLVVLVILVSSTEGFTVFQTMLKYLLWLKGKLI